MKRRRVLFVCVGNAFRSQMAEGFLRAYGGGEFEAFSAGVAPAGRLPRETIAMMAEKGIDVSGHFPKSLDEVPWDGFDVVVNMSGFPLPGVPHVQDWKVDDPLGGKEAKFRRVREEIEQRVQALLITLRRN